MEKEKVFIIYAHEDIDFARKLYEQLNTIPYIEPWLDKECLLPGLRWRPAIRKAIRESRFFIALFSEHSAAKRGYFQKEMKEALDILSQFPEDQIYFIPIRLEECILPAEQLRDIQYFIWSILIGGLIGIFWRDIAGFFCNTDY